ncbi:MAG: glycosyltransferase [Pseudobutyrivibrio sp.]|uniref:glycosyltransferase n=1 Tax=Pseudobutyrivibrio sp. TaxID=2014367 RepID=UPI001B77D3D8|nr:glycosyltransferase [Pseudobutyrivibrio sp.]MBP5324325.1 glycosyltransferase [Pseudobutyrivibrio sp.]MBR5648344.1 glycosyltransferase [Pseudobutyrivibrio sp.]
MKILLIDVNCKYSSTGKIVYDLYSRLNADGHEARIAYGRGDVIDEPGIYKFGIDSETKVHALLARITGKNGCYSPKSTARLIEYIKEFKPDLIHIHELHAYFVNHGQLLEFLKEQQIPVVWTFHCEYMYTGKCGFAYECSQYKSGCGNCPYIHEYVSSFGIDRTAKLLAEKKKSMEGLNLKAIVTPSKWLADRTKETYLYKNNIQVIHNGIDTDGIFYPRLADAELRIAYGIKPEDRLILAVAPNIMDVRKGGQTVLDLAETMPDTQFVLVGADETKRHSDNVQLIARTKNQDELARWYSEADLFIICSKAENFPTTCIEALCCGTPVVGLDECGTKETAPEPYGTFVNVDIAGDTDVKYAATLESLKEAVNTQLEKGLSSEEIRGFAVSAYDNKVMYNNYLDIYNICS